MLLQLHPSLTTSVVSDHFRCKSGPNLLSLFFFPAIGSCVLCSDVPVPVNVASLTFKKKTKKTNNHQNSLKQAPPHNSFHSFPPLPPQDVGCGGSRGDIALVLAVKWSICRYVCLRHRHPLTHSLLCSPDEQKRLIYSGFKDVAFSPIWLRFPRVCVFPFESQPNTLWWHLCVLHESTIFSWKKCSDSVVPAMKQNRKELKLGTIYVLTKEMDFSAQLLHNNVEPNVIKDMSGRTRSWL